MYIENNQKEIIKQPYAKNSARENQAGCENKNLTLSVAVIYIHTYLYTLGFLYFPNFKYLDQSDKYFHYA